MGGAVRAEAKIRAGTALREEFDADRAPAVGQGAMCSRPQ
jgi:hypothetical protein